MAATKLLTKAIATKVPALYAQDGKGMEAIAYVKFFTPAQARMHMLEELSLQQHI